VNLALAVSLALLARERSGVGQEIHVSLVGGLMALQAWELQHHLLSKTVPPRGGHSHPQIRTIWTSFAATDGDFVVAEVRDSWPGICRSIDRAELAADERFRSVGRRYKHREILRGILADAFGERTVDENVARLRAEGVMAAPVKDYAALAADPDVRANGYVRPFDHPTRGAIDVSGPHLHFSAMPPEIRKLAPALGEDTDAVLREVGYAETEITALREAKVLG
jgi:crotonobetainyl-CoA:carnitine CoA-transferase CaiB-like acyl-CoA transferase